MVEEFVALQCCECRTYQVQQSRKATKWLCRVCNQKQSIKQFYGRGSAPMCRSIVQTLNRQQFGRQDSDSTLWQSSQTECSDTSAGARRGGGDTPDTNSYDLDAFGTSDDTNHSSDDSLEPKRKKLSQNEEKIFCNTSNQLKTKRRVSKWTQFLK